MVRYSLFRPHDNLLDCVHVPAGRSPAEALVARYLSANYRYVGAAVAPCLEQAYQCAMAPGAGGRCTLGDVILDPEGAYISTVVGFLPIPGVFDRLSRMAALSQPVQPEEFSL